MGNGTTDHHRPGLCLYRAARSRLRLDRQGPGGPRGLRPWRLSRHVVCQPAQRPPLAAVAGANRPLAGATGTRAVRGADTAHRELIDQSDNATRSMRVELSAGDVREL